MTKERPILFSAPMVRAILDGRKRQTRRVAKEFTEEHAAILKRFPRQHGCKYGEPGDRLWVRESCRAYERPEDNLDGVIYGADGQWRPIENTWQASEDWLSLFHYRGKRGAIVGSIHMPRWASRILLEITDIRVERLQDISKEDAKAEGCGLYVPGHGFITESELHADPGYSNFLSPRLGFEVIWTEINGADSWNANQFVWAISFRRIEPPEARVAA